MWFYDFLQNKYMPNMDKTGPRGEGSMTGRGLGKCNDKSKKDLPNRSYGNNMLEKGLGRGMGRKNTWRLC